MFGSESGSMQIGDSKRYYGRISTIACDINGTCEIIDRKMSVLKRISLLCFLKADTLCSKFGNTLALTLRITAVLDRMYLIALAFSLRT